MYEKIRKISSELEGIVHKTPILTSKTLDKLTNFQLFIKCENFQKMGAFKFRGAYNAIRNLSDDEKKKGIITHSSGNHAQAIALAGKMNGAKAVIVMPNNAPQVKVNATKGYGAEIVFSEPTIQSRESTTTKLIEENGYTFVHPYDNQNVIEGAGTVTVEILDELDELDILIAPVGGGGLMSGSSIVAKESGKVKMVIGAEPFNANDAYLSIKEQMLIPQLNPNTIADGLRTELSELTYSYINKNVDEIVTVTEKEILEAMKFLFERMKIVVEPSGAVSVAAAIKLSKRDNIATLGFNNPPRVCVIISGGNIDLSEFFSYVEKKIE